MSSINQDYKSIRILVLKYSRMRSMAVSSSLHSDEVDEILLYVAFVGEVVWNSAELANFLTGQGITGCLFHRILLHILRIF